MKVDKKGFSLNLRECDLWNVVLGAGGGVENDESVDLEILIN